MADSYTALYRELRPRLFSDIVAQDHIKQTLRNQIISERVSHAYLFCGTKGTGKTSTAKVFARAVNCKSFKDGEPCGVDGKEVCASCESIISGRSLDVIEIDAASNNGVDNIRDIREEVKYPPTDSKYRVYIIDEVHMLSAGAFNALLKTLEEPPDHAIFILATTDFQKVPPTVMSRCQRFEFKRIPANEIAKCIKNNLSKQNNVSFDDDAVDYIARISDGSLRDAFSVLDQCISCYYGEKISLEMVHENLGAVDDSVFFEMTDAISSFNSSKCIELIDRISADGRDIYQFAGDLIIHFRNLLVSAVSIQSVNASAEAAERLKAQSSNIDANVLISYVSSLSTVQSQMRYAPNPRALLEVACLKLCNPEVSGDYSAIYARLNKLEAAIEGGIALSTGGNRPKKSSHEVTESIVDNVDEALHEAKIPAHDNYDRIAQEIKSGWKKFTGTFEMALKPLLTATKPEFIAQTLYIVCENGHESMLKNKKSFIGSRMIETFGEDFNFEITCLDDFARIKGVKHGDSNPQGKKSSTAINAQKNDDSSNELDKMLEKINFNIEIE